MVPLVTYGLPVNPVNNKIAVKSPKQLESFFRLRIEIPLTAFQIETLILNLNLKLTSDLDLQSHESYGRHTCKRSRPNVTRFKSYSGYRRTDGRMRLHYLEATENAGSVKCRIEDNGRNRSAGKWRTKPTYGNAETHSGSCVSHTHMTHLLHLTAATLNIDYTIRLLCYIKKSLMFSFALLN